MVKLSQSKVGTTECVRQRAKTKSRLVNRQMDGCQLKHNVNHEAKLGQFRAIWLTVS